MGKYTKQRANIGATRRILKQARMGEFKYAQGALESIYGNLEGTLGGGRADLMASQRHVLGRLAKLQHRQDVGSRRISGQARSNISRLYGSATTGAVSSQLKTVDVLGAAGSKSVGAQRRASDVLATGNRAAMSTLAQGIDLARAGADAQLADALMYRAKNDGQLIADQQFQLEQMKLQNKLDIQNYKTKLKLEADAEARKTGVTNTSASSLAEFVDGQMPSLIEIMRDEANYPEGEDHVPPGTAVQLWAAEMGIGPEDPRYQVALSAAQSIATKGGVYRDSVSDSVMQTLALLYPDLKPRERATLDNIVTASADNWFAQVEPVGARGDGSAITPSQTREVGGNTYDTATGYAVPTPPPAAAKGVKAKTDGSTMGTAKDGRAYRYIGGNPYYQDTGYIVPANFLP